MCQSEKDFFFSPPFSWVKNQNGLPINLDGIRLGLSSSEIVRWWKFPSNVRTLPSDYGSLNSAGDSGLRVQPRLLRICIQLHSPQEET